MKIGVIGTGLMGAPMALRLLSSGHQVWVYNRTKSRLKPLELAGARACNTPGELLAQVEAVILMVTNAEAVRSLLLGEGEVNVGTAPASPLGQQTILQMGTIAPAESQALQREFQTLGASYLEAPVLGSIPEAKNGGLQVMVGAESKDYQQWAPLLKCFGERIYHVGPVGTAAALKLAMNQLIGSLTSAFAQSLGLIQKQGIDVDVFMEVLRQSALYAPTFDKKLPRMQSRDFADPNFPAKHLLKDMGLFTETARENGIEVSPAERVQQIVKLAVESGWAEDDYSALFNVISPCLDEETEA